MKLLSRFKKGKKSDGADSQAVADSDEEGLLMPTEDLLMPTAPAQPSADSGGNSQAVSDAMLAAAESGGGGGEGEASAAPAAEDDLLAAAQSGAAEGEDDVDELLAAAQSGAAEGEDDVDDLPAAAQAPPAADEIKPEEPTEADAADDDPLSAFKDVEVHTDLADITNDIEEITIADLLEYVRDVREMLPATPAEDEDAA